ncbi:DUF4296 domain-containing protein [Lacinutrix undariae]
MKKSVILILIVVCFFGCAHDMPPEPDKLMSEEKMADVLFDVFLLNSAKGIKKKTLEENGVLPETYIFKKHNIDSVQFIQNNNYYAHDTDTYRAILEAVKKRVDKEKKVYEAEKEKEENLRKVKRDSFKKAVKKLDTKAEKPVKE